jgi:hypothetical protein
MTTRPPADTTLIPPAPNYMFRAWSISPDGNRIAGTYLDKTTNVSRYFQFNRPITGLLPIKPLEYVPGLLSMESYVSGRGINDFGDIVGFVAVTPDASVQVPFYHGGEFPQLLQPVTWTDIPQAIQAGVPEYSEALGINNDRYVVGAFQIQPLPDGAPLDSDRDTFGFGVKYDEHGVQGTPEILSDEIQAQLIDDDTHHPISAWWSIDAINMGYDLLATAIVASKPVSVGGIRFNVGAHIPLVGLNHEGRRTWSVLRDPRNPTIALTGANAISGGRIIVGGTDDKYGFAAQLGAQGDLITFDLWGHPSAVSRTEFTGVSDVGIVVGGYDKIHPFVISVYVGR